MNNCIQRPVGAPDMVAGLVPCKAPGTAFTHEKPKGKPIHKHSASSIISTQDQDEFHRQGRGYNLIRIWVSWIRATRLDNNIALQ